mgnify:CR=1 FL=1
MEEKDGKKHVGIEFFYDKYSISVGGMRLLLAFDEDWREYEKSSFLPPVVEEISLGIDLFVLTFPTNSLPSIKLSGKLNTPLKANVEESKILNQRKEN